MASDNPTPTNSLVGPLLTDLYQITMAYAYWKNNRHEEPAVFELFFRKNPFHHGAFTIFAGLDEVVDFLQSFRFTQEDIDYLKSTPSFANSDAAFFDDYLLHLDCSQVQVQAMRPGSLAFPRVPLLIISGPLGICQLLETTLLTLVNYSSLIATNAARMMLRAQAREQDHGHDSQLPPQCNRTPQCAEFGLRRAQGPDGGFSASKYAILGGFDATSNVLAGKRLGVPIVGTHAHAFVQAYLDVSEVENLTVMDKASGEQVTLLEKVQYYQYHVLRDSNNTYATTNRGELAAFIAYAAAFPDSFLCLIDTYDTLKSGLLNFCVVALALNDLGYTPRGVRLDSGDLAALSIACAHKFAELAESQKRPFFQSLDIVASNDINEKTLMELNQQGHAITVYGIGTNLVTCQAQPALGCVFKLVELSNQPRLKLSQTPAKVLIPGRKRAFRLFGKGGYPLLDLIFDGDESATFEAGETLICRHPFNEMERVMVTPQKIEPLHQLYFDGGKTVEVSTGTVQEARAFVREQLKCAPPDLLHYDNPKPYPVMISGELYQKFHAIWQLHQPVPTLT